MVKEHGHRGHHIRKWFGTIISILLVLICLSFFLTAKPEQEKRSLIIHSDPLTVVTWEVADASHYTILIIPGGLQIEATHGMGWYAVDALWKLDDMDHRHGDLLTSSIEDACGFPMTWYMKPTQNISVGDTKEQILQSVINTTSLPSLLSAAFGKQTNMTVFGAVRVWRRLQNLAPDTVTVVDFRTTPMYSDVTLPDGSVVQRFDAMRYDALIGDALEDMHIRQDALRVALYNTTQKPGIAQQLARTIDHMGGFVVSVTNDTPELNTTCEIRGSSPILRTETAKMLAKNYQCSIKEGDTERADIEMRLGDGFVKRYLPF